MLRQRLSEVVYDHVKSRYFRTNQTLPDPEKGHQQEIKEASENLSFDQCSSLQSSGDFVVVAGLKLFMKPFHHIQATNMILPVTHFPLLWCVFAFPSFRQFQHVQDVHIWKHHFSNRLLTDFSADCKAF